MVKRVVEYVTAADRSWGFGGVSSFVITSVVGSGTGPAVVVVTMHVECFRTERCFSNDDIGKHDVARSHSPTC